MQYPPVRRIAEASLTGHATNVIAGVAVGLEATGAPVLVMSVALVTSFWLGNSSGLVEGGADGLFGTAVATMGMLSTAAYVLTMDIFGPIADNAGGIVEMSGQPEAVRAVTDVLDAVGNTTKVRRLWGVVCVFNLSLFIIYYSALPLVKPSKPPTHLAKPSKPPTHLHQLTQATTKGYAIGSAGLASFLLFSAYLDEVSAFTGAPFKVVDIAVPEVFVGGLLGATLIFVFAAWACAAVGRVAGVVVAEVRRQFAERPGIMTYAEKPDYARCVAIVAQESLAAMVAPGLLAVGAPVATGVLFK